MTDEPREFQIGLVMAGAISAGAYTAGVMDFLLEALEAWEAAKRSAPNQVPDHPVRLRALSGASAGAMVGAITVRSLATGVTPVPDVLAPPDSPNPDPTRQSDEFKNPFYAAWVQSIDIRHLLGSRDLASRSAKVRSVLDSTVLGEIATNVIKVSSPPRAKPPSYVNNPVDVFLTTVNLRGVPYGFKFAGQQTAYMHRMTAFADQVHFRLAWPNEHRPGLDVDVDADEDQVDVAPVVLDATRIDTAKDGNWMKLTHTALASGAFPIGLAPQELERKATDYDVRVWPIPDSDPLKSVAVANVTPATPECSCTAFRPIVPDWPEGIRVADPAKSGADSTYEYNYWNVDGGLMNNEPLELVRRVLAGNGRNARKGEEADRAVVMIDPFPNGSDVSKKYKFDPDLIDIILRMFGALKEQARFKPDELQLAAEDEVYSRYVISPIYIDKAGAITDPAMASAIMGGFGGFFAESFRRHDFQLGRRNCQRFLQRHFALPFDNPLFDSWRDDAARKQKYSFSDIDSKGLSRRLAPIIPLMDHLNPDVESGAEIPLPKRPHAADVDLEAVRAQVHNRVNLVAPRLIDGVPISGFLRGVLHALWRAAILFGLRGKIVDSIMAKIESEVKKLK
jgi:hypothetical protein